MNSVKGVIKAMTAWRDWLARLGGDLQIHSSDIGTRLAPGADGDTDSTAPSERHERNLFIYGLPPM